MELYERKLCVLIQPQILITQAKYITFFHCICGESRQQVTAIVIMLDTKDYSI